MSRRVAASKAPPVAAPATAQKATAKSTPTDALADVVLPSLGKLRLGGPKPAATEIGSCFLGNSASIARLGIANLDPTNWVDVPTAWTEHGGNVPTAMSVQAAATPVGIEPGPAIALRAGATHILRDLSPLCSVYGAAGAQDQAIGIVDEETHDQMRLNGDLPAYQTFLEGMSTYLLACEEAQFGPPGTPSPPPMPALNNISFPIFPNHGILSMNFPAYQTYVNDATRQIQYWGQLLQNPQANRSLNIWIFDIVGTRQWTSAQSTFTECLCLGRFEIVRLDMTGGVFNAKLELRLVGNPSVYLDRTPAAASAVPAPNPFEEDAYLLAKSAERRNAVNRRFDTRLSNFNAFGRPSHPSMSHLQRAPRMETIYEGPYTPGPLLRSGTGSPWYSLEYEVDPETVFLAYKRALYAEPTLRPLPLLGVPPAMDAAMTQLGTHPTLAIHGLDAPAEMRRLQQLEQASEDDFLPGYKYRMYWSRKRAYKEYLAKAKRAEQRAAVSLQEAYASWQTAMAEAVTAQTAFQNATQPCPLAQRHALRAEAAAEAATKAWEDAQLKAGLARRSAELTREAVRAEDGDEKAERAVNVAVRAANAAAKAADAARRAAANAKTANAEARGAILEARNCDDANTFVPQPGAPGPSTLQPDYEDEDDDDSNPLA